MWSTPIGNISTENGKNPHIPSEPANDSFYVQASKTGLGKTPDHHILHSRHVNDKGYSITLIQAVTVVIQKPYYSLN